jgi:predicted negative regulator of RcsB-dependent stress response
MNTKENNIISTLFIQIIYFLIFLMMIGIMIFCCWESWQKHMGQHRAVARLNESLGEQVTEKER